jgi:hypothetical protein
MAKFRSQTMPVTAPGSPLTVTGPTLTHEGGAGFSRDPQSDLFLFAAVNMVGEDTFYEGASERDTRFRNLIWQCVRRDPGWVARFVPFLRNEMNMRSASVVMAAEYALCLRDALYWADVPGQGPVARGALESAPPVRQVIASALQRADEPGEFVAYWTLRTGKRTLPAGVQRGLSDAMARLYSQSSVIKYDGTGQPWRMGDVVELVHPDPTAVVKHRTQVLQADLREAMVGEKADLYRYLLDRRHHPDDPRVSMDRLGIINAAREFLALPPAAQRAAVLADPDVLDRTKLTWEILSSSGAMDKAAWEAIIPRMGYMALLRNLRNFDQAGVSDTVAEQVTAKLTDPDEVARSRQFPYRFLSAYRSVESLRWGPALEKALTLATVNVPDLPGRTLVLIDTSGSMAATVSGNSKVRRDEVGALFGYVLAARTGGRADVVGFASGSFRADMPQGGSVLRAVEAFMRRNGQVGYGTEMVAAVRKHYDGHDRVVILSDMQAFGGYGGSVTDAVPQRVPMFGVNLAGYSPGVLDLSTPNRYEIAGFSDRLFTMIDTISRGKTADWPF